MSNDPKTEAEVRAFFDEYVEAYPKDDIQGYLNLFQQDENLVMFGTDEKWLGWEEYKSAAVKYNERRREISLTYDWLNVNSHGKVAWIAAEVNFKIKVEGEWRNIPARLTSVIKKNEDKWKIVQGHISVPG
ncbi:MAG: nuclear transport factor 2 family protein [Candidatus Heimdallarchaeota archaeon]|nr:nuclear transport factor 2 family protein [Candidatus Heimdallarchaeota archaeon]MCG3257083.1 nuclear transport factor 2 family protein [Candidatus Heimdallarchaeota archaeon]MCK4612143.1 nuclear transport factor 2 family protein [Candidatus Heimdallarchaeota archaeon]